MPTFPGRPELLLVHQPRSPRAMVDGLERALRLGRGRAWVVTGSPDELATLRRRVEGVRFTTRPGRATLAVGGGGPGIPSQRSSQRR
jgi:hypothetical protein